MAATPLLTRIGFRAWLIALLVVPLRISAADTGDGVAARYRELNLVLMVAEGAGDAWIDALAPDGDDAPVPPGRAGLEPPVRVQDLQTPLNRIVDPRRTVADAARLFRFANRRRQDIRAELVRIAAAHPEAVAAADPVALAEDALIVRSGLATAIEFLGRGEPERWMDGLESYRRSTVHLRNTMEFWTFDQELAAITDQALLDTGTRIEAYQRLLEVDPRLDAFSQHLRAVEFIYRQYGKKVKPPEDPSDELIEKTSRVD